MTAAAEETFSFGAEFGISDYEIIELYGSQREFGWWTRNITTDSGNLSREVCDLLGIDPAQPEFERLGIVSAVHPDDQDMVINAMGQLMTDKRWIEASFRVPKSDGSEKLVRMIGDFHVRDDGTEEIYGVTYSLFPNLRWVGFVDPA